MSTRERPADPGRARGQALVRALGVELRVARVNAGLSQDHVGAIIGVSGSQIGRIERGRAPDLGIWKASTIAAAVGLDLVVRTYPGGAPVHDAGHLALLSRLRTRLGDGWDWRFEVPVAPHDQRAWDAVLTRAGTGARVVVEAETRIADIQALLRKLASKRNASANVRLVLLVADSRRNREALGLASAVLATEFPTSSREALAAMLRSRAPARDALIKL